MPLLQLGTQPIERSLLSLRHPAGNMRNGAVLALPSDRSQADFLPLSCLEKPLVGGARDVASIEKVWPDNIDAL